MGWARPGGLAGEQVLLAGKIGVLRREQARLAAVGETSPLRRSALFGLANRYRQEKVAAEIIQRNRELAAADSAYSLAKYGARGWPASDVLLVDGVFQVYRQGDSNYLRYAREDCAAADVAARFFCI